MSRTKFRAARRPGLSVEQLADRIVPTFMPPMFAGGVLTLTSDNVGDMGTVTTRAADGAILLNNVATGATVANTTSIIVNGGGGNDVLDLSGLTGYGGAVTIDGGDGDDSLIGTNGTIFGIGGDTLRGGAGNDTLDGRGGFDDLDGGIGNDSLLGGTGDDTLRDGSGADTFDGGLGSDRLVAVSFFNTFDVTGTNAGTLNGDSFSSVENLTGGIFFDTFNFQPLGRIDGNLDGGLGTDTLSYERVTNVSVNLELGSATDVGGGASFRVSGIENVTGGSGNDALTGDGLANVLNGGAGNDTLDGRAGNDTLDGGLGNDTLLGGAGNDTLRDSVGIDSFDGGAGSDTLRARDGVANTFNVTGANAGNLLNPGSGNQTFSGLEILVGGNGDDTFNFLTGGLVDGSVNGGGGINTLSYQTRLTGVSVNLRVGSATDIGGGAAGRVSNIRNVVGGQGPGSNSLEGDARDNTLVGGPGNDVLIGGLGNDVLIGGGGFDLIIQ